MSEEIKLNDSQQAFVDAVLNSLEEERVPWRRPWMYAGSSQYNPVSGVKYKGTNQMMLEMYGNMRNQDDPRWCTFKQAQEKGWRIKKGSKSVKIFYPLLWNKEKNRFLTAEDFEGLSEQEKQDLKDSSTVRLKFFSVFNGSDIIGIPKLKQTELKGAVFNNEEASRVADNIIESMPIEVTHKNQEQAYFFSSGSGSEGIVMPLKEQFLSEEGYYSTLFHELSHATGSQKHLNRESLRVRSKSNYSEEELVAEFSSTFLSKDLGFAESNSFDEEMSATYIKGWYSTIKNDPNIIFRALKNATAAYKYLFDLGKVQEIKKERELAEAQKVDTKVLIRDVLIADYAKDVLGLNIVSKGRNLFSTQEHDSLMIYGDKNDFFRFSSSVGGNIINFIMHFEDVDKETAIQRATNYYHQYNPEVREYKPSQKKEKIENINLPEPAPNNSIAQAYLVKERGLPIHIVNQFIREGLIYQDKRNNVVFVGKFDDSALYATLRGTAQDSNFKGDVEGSIKEVGVFKSNHSDTLVLTESCIDMMSFMTLQADSQAYDYLSVNGISNAKGALNFHLMKRKEADKYNKVVIAFDNDKKGEEATLDMIDYIKESFPMLEVFYTYPKEKDWNEDLLDLEKKRGTLTFDSIEADITRMGKGLGL